MSSDNGPGVLDDALNAFTNFTTFGTVGFDKDNLKFSTDKGVNRNLLKKPTTSALKDLTGATAAEEANRQKQARFEEEKAARAQQRVEDIATHERNQVTASRLAGANRKTTNRSSRGTSRASSLGTDESDFLGL